MSRKKNEFYADDDIKLARFAKALGHPARITMLRNLASLNTCCFNDLSNKLPIADSTVAQHIKALKDSGLIQGSLEPPKVKYCINKENWKLARSLLRDFIGIKIKKII